MAPSYSKHLRILLWLTGISLAAVAVFNLLADPYASFGLFSRTRFSHSAAGLGTRTGKGEMLAHHDWDVLLVGTSRVETGLDPAHPAFAGLRTYNAGMAGADFPELDQAARLAIKRGTLKRLILCVDLFCFDPYWEFATDIQRSLLNPHLNPIEYRLSNLLSTTATELSIETVQNALHHQDGKRYPLGLYMPRETGPRFSRATWIAGGYLKLTLPKGIESAGDGILGPSKFAALSNLLTYASRAGVKVDLVQLPMHVVSLEGYFAIGRWPVYEQWVSTLTRIVAKHNQDFPGSPVTFWDFCDYDPFTTDPAFNTSRWFLDPFHIRVALGDLVLDRIMNFPPPSGTSLDDFGLIMTEANLQPHLAQLRRDHQAYYNRDPEVEKIHQLIRDDMATRDSE